MPGGKPLTDIEKGQILAYHHENYSKKAIERIVRVKGKKAMDIQVAFLALNKKGETGAFAIHKGFSYALKAAGVEKLVAAKSVY